MSMEDKMLLTMADTLGVDNGASEDSVEDLLDPIVTSCPPSPGMVKLKLVGKAVLVEDDGFLVLTFFVFLPLVFLVDVVIGVVFGFGELVTTWPCPPGLVKLWATEDAFLV